MAARDHQQTEIELELADPAATEALARALAALVAPGEVIALDGELGAGKTTLARALVAALGGDSAAVASPTFTLLHRYDARVPVVHVDAYRLRSAGDLAALGFDDATTDAVALVEWAERVRDALDPARTWWLALAHRLGGGRRARLAAPPGKRLEASTVTAMLR